MTISKLFRSRVLVPAVVGALAAGLTTWGLPQAVAITINQTINGGPVGYHQMPNITGSVNAAQNMRAFIKDNQRVVELFQPAG